MASADDRRFEVLRAIVADFVATKEPIGSKSLVERHNLGVSSATVRNDMAVLEAEGYIAQPHTSSGRVPTEKGYREFVDRLEDVKPLSSAEALATYVPDPARRRTKPACCNSRTARPTVILEVLNRFNRAASLGSFCPGRYRPERMSVLILSRTC